MFLHHSATIHAIGGVSSSCSIQPLNEYAGKWGYCNEVPERGLDRYEKLISEIR